MNIIELIKCKYDSADVLSNEEKAIIYNLLTFHTDIFEQIEKDIDNICFINGNVFFFQDVCEITMIIAKNYTVFFKLLLIKMIHLPNIVYFTVEQLIESQQLTFSCYDKEILMKIVKNCIELLRINNDGVIIKDVVRENVQLEHIPTVSEFYWNKLVNYL